MSMSNYLENKLIDHIFRDTAYTKPSALYIALLTTACVDSDTGTNLTAGTGTGVEVSTSGTAYARLQYDPSSSSRWEATQGGVSGASSGTGGQTSNNTALTWSTATASWGTVVGVAIVDAATNGNIIASGTLAVSKTVTTGDIYQFNANQLTMTLD